MAALDPFRGYATALRTTLPQAIRVLDAFHVVRLGFDAVDQVRRRVQQETLGHRGRAGDPLFGIRRLLRRGHEHHTSGPGRGCSPAWTLGDVDEQVGRGLDRRPGAAAALPRARPATGPNGGCCAGSPTSPSTRSPNCVRLARTLDAWRDELLAYFDTGGVSNGPTEAVNALIKKIKRVGHGYRNFDNYRLRLLLHCGVDWHTPPATPIRGRLPRLAA